MPFFDKIGKTVSDLFKKGDYNLNRTVKLTIPDGDTKVEVTVKEAGGVNTKVKYTQKGGIPGITSRFGGDFSLQTDTNDQYVLESKKNKFGDNVDADLKVDTAKNNVGTKIRYKNKNYAAQVNLDSNYQTKDIGFNSSLVFGTDGVSVGAQAKGKVKSGNLGAVDFDVAVDWANGDSNYSLKTSNYISNVALAASKAYGKDTVAASLNHDIERGTSSAAIGGEFGLDNKSTVKGFLETSGNIFALYKYKFSDRVGFEFGAQANLGDLSKFSNVGYKLSFQ